MDAFISKTPYFNKIPPMTVYVLNKQGNELRTYDTPAGFQLEIYLISLYPKATLSLSWPQNKTGTKDFRIDISTHAGLIETHLGVYQI